MARNIYETPYPQNFLVEEGTYSGGSWSFSSVLALPNPNTQPIESETQSTIIIHDLIDGDRAYEFPSHALRFEPTTFVWDNVSMVTALLNDATGIDEADTIITYDNIENGPFQPIVSGYSSGIVRMGSEIMFYSDVTSTQLTVTRGEMGTTAYSHADNDKITSCIIRDRIERWKYQKKRLRLTLPNGEAIIGYFLLCNTQENPVDHKLTITASFRKVE